MKTPWILFLDTENASVERMGGKGASLAQLTTAGFPVPPGFVVTTAAYRAFVAENCLEDLILSTAGGLSTPDLNALEAASRTIRAAFAAGHLPPGLADAVLAAYDTLGRPAVAVRSSATAEDLPGISSAGQQDTYLNVGDGAAALLQAIVDCWSSLWTARAIGYRARDAAGYRAPDAAALTDLALAVVVQEMVPSRASGVLFTANPLTGKRTEMAIEATLGLGEALVSGQVEPDRYVVAAGSGQIESRTLGTKALSIQPRAGGGTVAVSAAAADRYALPDAVVGELAHLGRDVAGFFGTPQDVEWAWARGRLYLLQSRPITSLFPLPPGTAPEPLQAFFSFGAVQGMLEPITPLGRDAIAGILAGAGRLFGYRLTVESQRIVHVAAGRLFLDVTSLFRHKAGRRLLHFASSQIEPGMIQALEGLLQDPRLAVTGGFTPAALRRIVPFVARVAGRLILSLLRPETARLRFQRQVEALIAGYRTRMRAATTLEERLVLAEEMLDGTFPFLLPRFVSRFGASMAGLNLLNHLAAGVPGGDHDALLLTRGLPHNVTTEMDLALWATSRRIEADPQAAACFERLEPAELAAGYAAARLPQAAQDGIDAFLEQYGARGVGEIDLGRPRWREDPTPVLQVLSSYLHLEAGTRAPDVSARAPDVSARAPDVVFARGAATARAAIDRLAEEVRSTRAGRLKAWLVRGAARRLRTLAGLREMPKFCAVRMMDITRAALLASGRQMVAAGRLAAPDDVFFLHLSELHALAAGEARDWPALVDGRRAAYAREQQRRQIPRLLLSDGQAFYDGLSAPPSSAANVLAGSPVSPGTVQGTVHVVLDPRASELAPGEILVCPGTDPAWTPLFLLAAGLVTEVGGLMTHGSVVAREYGIPAVVGVSHATTRLQTGQRIELDGTRGRIVVLPPERNE